MTGVKSIGKIVVVIKVIVVAVLVVISVALLCTGVGGILGAMALGALLGALSGGVSNMAVTTISLYLENGTFPGSLGSILLSEFSGALADGILGGLMGGLSFELNQAKIASAADTSKSATASRKSQLKSMLSKGELPRATSAAVIK